MATIFDQYLQAPKSVLDYSSEMDKNEGNQLALLAARRQNADDLAMRQAGIAAGGDQNALVKALMGQGLVKQAQAVQTAGLTNNKTVADTGLANAHAANFGAQTSTSAYDMRMKKHDQAVKDISNFQTPQEAAANLQSHIQAGDIAPDQGQAILQTIPQDPAQFPQWQVKMLRNLMAAKDQVALMQPDANTVARNATLERGQDMTNQRAGQQQAAEKNKPPAGYAWGPKGEDGNPTLIAVKGGPADLKMAGALNQDTQALSGSMNSFDRLAVAANEALNHPGLKSVYGLRGAVPNIPGTQAADAAALLNTLKSQVGFSVLQDMRNNSKTGGALGAVSDRENAMLQANLAALEKAQSFEQAQKSLAKIVKYSEDAKVRLRDAYNLKHGQGSVNPARGGATGDSGAPGKVVNFSDLK